MLLRTNENDGRKKNRKKRVNEHPVINATGGLVDWWVGGLVDWWGSSCTGMEQ